MQEELEVTVQEDMIKRKGDKIDMKEETTAPMMIMKEKEEGEEETTAQKIEAAGDILVMKDEDTAQGP